MLIYSQYVNIHAELLCLTQHLDVDKYIFISQDTKFKHEENATNDESVWEINRKFNVKLFLRSLKYVHFILAGDLVLPGPNGGRKNLDSVVTIGRVVVGDRVGVSVAVDFVVDAVVFKMVLPGEVRMPEVGS